MPCLCTRPYSIQTIAILSSGPRPEFSDGLWRCRSASIQMTVVPLLTLDLTPVVGRTCSRPLCLETPRTPVGQSPALQLRCPSSPVTPIGQAPTRGIGCTPIHQTQQTQRDLLLPIDRRIPSRERLPLWTELPQPPAHRLPEQGQLPRLATKTPCLCRAGA